MRGRTRTRSKASPSRSGHGSLDGRPMSVDSDRSLRSGRNIEAVEIHHLAPRSRKVMHKLLLRVRACIDFRYGAKLRVRTEDEIDGGTGPLDLTRRPAVVSLVEVLALGG